MRDNTILNKDQTLWITKPRIHLAVVIGQHKADAQNHRSYTLKTATGVKRRNRQHLRLRTENEYPLKGSHPITSSTIKDPENDSQPFVSLATNTPERNNEIITQSGTQSSTNVAVGSDTEPSTSHVIDGSRTTPSHHHSSKNTQPLDPAE